MNFDLLRPVIFAELKVGDVLQTYTGMAPTIAYKGPDFAVLRFKDGSEGPREIHYLESDYKLKPLTWVEGKPAYEGDELYRPEVEGDGVLVASHITCAESGIEYLYFSDQRGAHEYADNRRGYLTWTKPEPKHVPSFQVEGQDVFPGDVVYYYGDDKLMWGRGMIVEKDSCVSGVHAESFEKGATSFRLKPMLVIGDHLVPMPVRNAAEMKNGDSYYIPSLSAGYLKCVWSNRSFDFEVCNKGLVHRTKEASIAHGEAAIALSEKKD